MSDTKRYLSAVVGSEKPYFPPMYEKPDCACCEKREECPNADKFQRDRRDFTYTSGRCPRLPDMRGFVDRDEQELYAQTFPIVYVERAECEVHLSISLPGKKRLMKVYRNYCRWWFRDGKNPNSGYKIRRLLALNCRFQTNQDIYDYMKDRNWYHLILPVDITDEYL